MKSKTATIVEAQEIMGMSRITILNWIHAGQLPGTEKSNSPPYEWRIPYSGLLGKANVILAAIDSGKERIETAIELLLGKIYEAEHQK